MFEQSLDEGLWPSQKLKHAKYNLVVAKTRMDACHANVAAAKSLIELVTWQLSQGPRILLEQQEIVKTSMEQLPDFEKIYSRQEKIVEELKVLVASQTRPAGGYRNYARKDGKTESGPRREII